MRTISRLLDLFRGPSYAVYMHQRADFGELCENQGEAMDLAFETMTQAEGALRRMGLRPRLGQFQVSAEDLGIGVIVSLPRGDHQAMELLDAMRTQLCDTMKYSIQPLVRSNLLGAR